MSEMFFFSKSESNFCVNYTSMSQKCFSALRKLPEAMENI